MPDYRNKISLSDNFLEDDRSFKKLYDNYSNAILYEIFRLTKNSEIAKDLMQEVFFSIWQKKHQFDQSKGSVFTWMITIARRKCIDHFRKSRTHIVYYPLTDVNDKGVFDEHHSLEFDLLLKRFHYLTPRDLELIRLVYVYGYTHFEVSKKCNMPLGSVKTTLRKFIKKKAITHF